MKPIEYFLLGFTYLLAVPAVGTEITVDEIVIAGRISQASITSGIVRYERREWSAQSPLDDAALDLGEVFEDRLDESDLPLPRLQDTNVFIFQRDGDSIRWKLFRENTRDLSGIDPKILTENRLDYVLTTRLEDGISVTRIGTKGIGDWNFFLKRSDSRGATLYGDPEEFWKWGIDILLADSSIPIPDVVDKNIEIRSTKEGNVEIVRLFTPESEIQGVYYSTLYDPINQGRCSRVVRFATPNELGESENGSRQIASEAYYGDFKEFSGIRIPTRKVFKIYGYLPKGDGFARGISDLSEIVLTDVQLNVPVSDADLVVGMEEGDHVYDFLEEGTVKEFIVGQEEDE